MSISWVLQNTSPTKQGHCLCMGEKRLAQVGYIAWVFVSAIAQVHAQVTHVHARVDAQQEPRI
jgi:hypothetical protein